MKPEIIEVLVKFKIEYDSEKLRKEAIARLLKDTPRHTSVFGEDGYYSIKQVDGASFPISNQIKQ